nr:hypothetical protein [Nitrosomonas nitrosa]
MRLECAPEYTELKDRADELIRPARALFLLRGTLPSTTGTTLVIADKDAHWVIENCAHKLVQIGIQGLIALCEYNRRRRDLIEELSRYCRVDKLMATELMTSGVTFLEEVWMVKSERLSSILSIDTDAANLIIANSRTRYVTKQRSQSAL